MSSYQQEQREAHQMVLTHLQSLSAAEKESLFALTDEYLAFRKNVNAFFLAHLSDICTLKCYQSRLSACCSKEGVIVFFADVVVNALVSNKEKIDALIRILGKANEGFKCIYPVI